MNCHDVVDVSCLEQSADQSRSVLSFTGNNWIGVQEKQKIGLVITPTRHGMVRILDSTSQ